MSSKPRKNYSVVALLFRVNHMSRHSTCSAEQRKGMQGLLEDVLMATDNYKGFNYLSIAPVGHKPGINSVAALANASQEEMFDGTDETRRTYYVSDTLRAEYQEIQEMQDASVEKYRSNGGTDAEKWLCTDIGR